MIRWSRIGGPGGRVRGSPYAELITESQPLSTEATEEPFNREGGTARTALLFGLGGMAGVSLACGVLLWVPRHALAEGPPPTVTIAYAPEADLERIDVGLIGEARATIDVAAYVLTDRPVAEALERAAERGVSVRVVVDSGAPDLDAGELLERLAATKGVEVRIKPAGDLMHLKAYAIDGQTVRLGSANFSRSG